jgi:hypothetical protein
MAIVWNPGTFQYEWRAGEDPSAWQDRRLEAAQMGVRAMPTSQQFGVAARNLFGSGYAARPYLGQAVARQMDPLMGQYILDTPLDQSGETDTGTFGGWLQGRQFGGTAAGRYATPFGPGSVAAGGPDEAAGKIQWQDLMAVARAQNPILSDVENPETMFAGRPVAGQATTTQYPVQWGDDASKIYYDQLMAKISDEEDVRALTALATFNPAQGGVRGRLRQRGQQMAQQRYFTQNPAAGAVDWLGYVSGQPGWTQAGYQV